MKKLAIEAGHKLAMLEHRASQSACKTCRHNSDPECPLEVTAHCGNATVSLYDCYPLATRECTGFEAIEQESEG